jgi:ATP-dependent Clp protease ATP-binding subunit ClpB
LTELVRRRPYSVLLFDEIEKAHPDVFNIFLQILDDGRLTDGKGRTVDFKNTLIIMTSNIGSQIIHEAMNGIDHAIGMTAKKASAVGEAGALSEGLKREIQALLLQHFRPEFLNRIDEVVIFNALGKREIEKIIDLQLQNLRRTLSERKIDIKLTERARELLFEQGYDPQFGARPLKRAIQRLIQDPLAMKLLDGEIAPGESLVVDADPKRGEMIFQPAVAKAART